MRKNLSTLRPAIATINAWNRLAISARVVPGTYELPESRLKKSAEGCKVARGWMSAEAGKGKPERESRKAKAGKRKLALLLWREVSLARPHLQVFLQ